MKNSMQKRIILLWKYLYEHTDEQHPATTSELIRYLATEDIHCDRRCIYDDTDLLQKLGVDIICQKSRRNYYHIGNRHFQLPELKLMVDAIQSSRFITPKKSKELIDKLRVFAGEHQASQLDQQIYMDGTVKPENERIYLTVDVIHNAITENRKITFQYADYTPSKEKVYRRGGELYIFSPYVLIWDRDFYYVIGYSDIRGAIASFRVDRIEHTSIIDEPGHMDSEFDVTDYGKEIFGMYPDKVQGVELLCRNDLMRSVIDRFGEEVNTRIVDSEHFMASVEVAPSPPFFAWVFTFGGGIQIVSPPEALDEMRRMSAWLCQ